MDAIPGNTKKLKSDFISEYFGYYYLLFAFSYLSIYYFPALTPFINVFILVYSYYLIIAHNRFDAIVILILFSRCLNGFIIPHSKIAYTIVNLLANVLPIMLYFASLLYKKHLKIDRGIFYRHKFTLLFFVFLSISFIINFSSSYDLISKRYLPFLFFVGFLFFCEPSNFKVEAILRFLRVTFFSSLVLYVMPDYLHITQRLIESDSVFSVASAPNSYSLVYMTLIRNLGFFWDHRILAIVAYLFLVLTLVFRPKYFKLDILLSFLIVITTTSRGGMVTFALVMLVYFFQVYRYKVVYVATVLILIVSGFLYFAENLFSSSTVYFIRSFNPQSKYNAISQRKAFSDYALEAFQYHPVVGNGVGFLSSHTINRDLVVDGVKIPAVGDAYWYVLLAEMGLLGLILYALFLMEVFYSPKLVNIALLIGFAVQLLGTDIPDMRFYYFAILIMVYLANIKLSEKLPERLTLHHEN